MITTVLIEIRNKMITNISIFVVLENKLGIVRKINTGEGKTDHITDNSGKYISDNDDNKDYTDNSNDNHTNDEDNNNKNNNDDRKAKKL